MEYAWGLEIETLTGFYLTEFTVEQLKYYQANRDQYPDFAQFVPYLLEQYKQHQEELLDLTRKTKELKIKEVKIEGNLYPINNRVTWGFWLALTDEEYKKLTPGVTYRLVPKTDHPECKWVMDQAITLVLPE